MKKISICKHCKTEFDTAEKPKGWMANHSRWCDYNPKSKVYKNSLIERNIDLHKEGLLSNQFIKAKEKGITLKHSEETKKKISASQIGKIMTEEHKKNISIGCLNSPHQRVCKKTVEYICLDGSIVKMDSSWEVKVAKILDDNNMVWERPKPLKWTDKNEVVHNYFPDFYLVEYDVYLDPKNDWVIETQKEKLKCLEEQYSNIYILTTQDLNIDYIKSVIKYGSGT